MLRDLPTPAELSAVRRHLERYDMTLVHRSIFRRAIQLAFHKTVRPPSKKHLGTNLRKIDPLPCIPEIFHELTSTARGLPETSPLEGIQRPSPPGYPQRKQGDRLLPMKTSSVRKLYGAKLQRQDSVKAVCRFEDFEPRTSLGAVRMMLRREPNEQGTGRSWEIKAFGNGCAAQAQVLGAAGQGEHGALRDAQREDERLADGPNDGEDHVWGDQL